MSRYTSLSWFSFMRLPGTWEMCLCVSQKARAALKVNLQLTVMYDILDEVKRVVCLNIGKQNSLSLTLLPFKGKHGHGPLQSLPAHGSCSFDPCTHKNT